MPEPSDLDILMSYIHEINAKTAAEFTDHDATVLIGYHRHNRARRASGYKPAKIAAPEVDVLKMLGMSAKPKSTSTGPVRRL